MATQARSMFGAVNKLIGLQERATLLRAQADSAERTAQGLFQVAGLQAEEDLDEAELAGEVEAQAARAQQGATSAAPQIPLGVQRDRGAPATGGPIQPVGGGGLALEQILTGGGANVQPAAAGGQAGGNLPASAQGRNILGGTTQTTQETVGTQPFQVGNQEIVQVPRASRTTTTRENGLTQRDLADLSQQERQESSRVAQATRVQRSQLAREFRTDLGLDPRTSLNLADAIIAGNDEQVEAITAGKPSLARQTAQQQLANDRLNRRRIDLQIKVAEGQLDAQAAKQLGTQVPPDLRYGFSSRIGGKPASSAQLTSLSRAALDEDGNIQSQAALIRYQQGLFSQDVPQAAFFNEDEGRLDVFDANRVVRDYAAVLNPAAGDNARDVARNRILELYPNIFQILEAENVIKAASDKNDRLEDVVGQMARDFLRSEEGGALLDDQGQPTEAALGANKVINRRSTQELEIRSAEEARAIREEQKAIEARKRRFGTTGTGIRGF